VHARVSCCYVFKKSEKAERERERESTIGDRKVDMLPCSVRVTFPDRRYRDRRPLGIHDAASKSEQQDELMRRGSDRARYAAFMLIGASASAYPRIKLMDARGYSRDKSRMRWFRDHIAVSVIHTETCHANRVSDCMRIDGNVIDCSCKAHCND